MPSNLFWCYFCVSKDQWALKSAVQNKDTPLTSMAQRVMLGTLHHQDLVLTNTQAVRCGRAPFERLQAQICAVSVGLTWFCGGAAEGEMTSGTALTHGVTHWCTCGR